MYVRGVYIYKFEARDPGFWCLKMRMMERGADGWVVTVWIVCFGFSESV